MRMQSFIAASISSILFSLALITGLDGASLPVVSSKRVWIFVVKFRAILLSSVLPARYLWNPPNCQVRFGKILS